MVASGYVTWELLKERPTATQRGPADKTPTVIESGSVWDDIEMIEMSRGSDENAKRPRAWMSWSSGKDSGLALHEVRSAGEVDVIGLVTTVNSTADRVAMHAVRRVLLEAQADALDLPLYVVDLPWPSANELYEQRMSAAVEVARQSGVKCFVFGDLFLEDVRAYRLAMLDGTGITPLFPLWGRATNGLAREMLVQGVKAVITCVDPAQAPRSIAGRWYDEALLSELPPDIDPCGENGEFHTFVVDGPGFAHPLEVGVGEVVERDGFVFADVFPADHALTAPNLLRGVTRTAPTPGLMPSARAPVTEGSSSSLRFRSTRTGKHSSKSLTF